MNKKEMKYFRRQSKKAAYLKTNKALKAACFQYARKRDIIGLIAVIEGIIIVGLLIKIILF